MASIYGSAHVHFLVDGNNVTGSVTIPNTGGWQKWTTLTTKGFNLSAGKHTLKLVDESTGFNVDFFDVTQ
jgi:hypothetical protein